MDLHTLFQILGLVVVAAPSALLALLGCSSLFGRPFSESTIGRLTQALVVTGLLAAVAILVLMLVTGERRVPIELGHWVKIPNPHEHFHFKVEFVFDRLSVPFVILTFVLCGTIGAFANVYMHREAGFARFFLFYAMFLVGMVVSSLAGTIETLFAGWELVGLSSALLVAFFHYRPAPVRNGLQVWSVYRVADAAFLIAAIAMHHLTGEGEFDKLMGSGAWPAGEAHMSTGAALFIGAMLLLAAAGKSALIPFSGWLPRAMEGPTPSSAVFYGALSVHLGAFLLLRVSPILELSVWLCAAVTGLGLATAIYAAAAARVQTDVKSGLAFASLTQVGLIVAEIGLGLRYIALIHIIGHACLRTLQLLRAPSLLRDYDRLENAIGGGALLEPAAGFLGDTNPEDGGAGGQPTGPAGRRQVPSSLRKWTYRFALERGYLDALLFDWLVAPLLRLFRIFDSLERRWTDFLSGGRSRESDELSRVTESLEDLQ